MLSLLHRIALRYVLSSPLRAALIALGVSLGVALQIATRSASRSVAVSFTRMVEQVSGKADVTIANRQHGLSAELTGELVDVEGVSHAAALLEIPVRDPKSGRPMLILGMDFLGDPYFLAFDPEQEERPLIDDPLAFANDPRALLVSRALAQRRNLKVGDDFELMTSTGPAAFHVRGIIPDVGPAAAFDGQVAVMFLDAAQVSFGRGDRVDRIQVAFDREANRQAVLDRVRKVVGKRGEVELPEERRLRFIRLVRPLHAVLTLASVLALVVAMFLTYNAVGIAVAQRRMQIGIVRALGATRSTVVALFCLEAFLLAIPASALGVLVGRFLAHSMLEKTLPTIAIAQGYIPLRPQEPTIDAILILEAVATGTLATIVAAFVPALRAARVDPAITVRSGAQLEATRSLPRRPMAFAGLILMLLIAASTLLGSMEVGLVASVLVAAVVVLVTPELLVRFSSLATRLRVPIVLRLGITSISRDLRRSTVSVIALATAVTFGVALGVWISSMRHSVTAWFERSVTADLQITAGSPINDQYNVPFSDAILHEIEKTPGLSAALPYRVAAQSLQGLDLVLITTDTALHFALQQRLHRLWTTPDGETFSASGFAAQRRIALSETAARRLGRRAGDRLELETPQGPIAFEVHAVIDSRFVDRPAIVMDRRWLVEHWNESSVDSVSLFVTPGANVDAVAEAVRERLGGGQALFVVRSGEVERQLLKVVDDSFGYARSIEWITLVVALMGVMGTMLAVVLDRRRELGVFRALGATRLQVALAVTAEAGALGLAAAVLGIVCGALQGFVVLKGVTASADWDLEYMLPPLVLGRVAVLVVLSTVLAALMPAYRAARIEVTRAIGNQ